MKWFGRRAAEEDRRNGLEVVRSEEDLDELARHQTAVLYKHSPACSLSARALAEIGRFAAERPDLPIYLLDVITSRGLAREVQERTGIRHESPQVVVFRAGDPTWHGSHRAVTREALARAVGAKQP